MTWMMPAETAVHERTWMAFPVADRAAREKGVSPSQHPDGIEATRTAWTAVAHAIAEFEPVTMVVDPGEVDAAGRHLSSSIETIVSPLDDAWIRDTGPTFVIDTEGRLGGVDWIFNGWGAVDGLDFSRDGLVAACVIDAVAARRISSVLVNEGGGIHVDGEGTVLLTETVQLDPGRNPWADKSRVEAELSRTIGATKFIWLPRGLTRDYSPAGTRGHVDILATIPSPGRVLVHQQNNRDHPDFEITREIRRVFENSADAAGRAWQIIDVPAPAALHDAEGFVDYSYINHLVVNGGVIACGFGEELADGVAREILADAYPGREIVMVDSRPVFARGGGIHCITQQQPVSTPV